MPTHHPGTWGLNHAAPAARKLALKSIGVWFELVAPKLPFGKTTTFGKGAPASPSARHRPLPDSPGPVTALSAAAPAMEEDQAPARTVTGDAKLQNMVVHVLRVATEVRIVYWTQPSNRAVASIPTYPVLVSRSVVDPHPLPIALTTHRPTISTRSQDKDANLRCAALKLLGTHPVLSAMGLVPDALFDCVFR